MFVTPISADETRLLTLWREGGGSDALQELIALYLPRMKAWARLGGELREDLVAEGLLALIEAANRKQNGAQFALGAHVRGAMLQARARMAAMVSLPERQIRDALAGRLPEDQAQVIREALKHENFDEFSSPCAVASVEEEEAQRDGHRQRRRALARALRSLDASERRLVLHPLLRGDQSLEQVAQGLGLSLQRARNLQGRALYKMRNTLLSNGFAMAELQ